MSICTCVMERVLDSERHSPTCAYRKIERTIHSSCAWREEMIILDPPYEDNPAYLVGEEWTIVDVRHYNPEYGDDRICECGHQYYRHFDSYDKMEPVGCKYCLCVNFEERTQC